MKNNKKYVYIALFGLDSALLIFFLVIAIIMLARTATTTAAELANLKVTDLISYFQKNPTAYFFIGVLPLFILLIVNIIILVLYVKATTKKEPVQVRDLSEEQKEALRQELLRDLMKDNKE